MTPLHFAGFGSYRPREIRPSTALDAVFGKPQGWTQSQFGIARRAIAAEDETTSVMGARAATEALKAAGWEHGDFDVLIGACGVMEQPIPGTAVLIQQALGLGRSGVPAFDVNQTCLSFLTALDIAAMGMESRRWRRALIVSSDIASAGLDHGVPATAAIFGDGAAAVCVEAGAGTDGPGLLARGFETYGEGRDLATVRAGGTRVRIEHGFEAVAAASRFEMDAFGIFKAAARCLPRLIDRVLDEAGLTRDDLDLIICHQASAPGVEHVRRLFAPGSHRVIDIFADHGNQIAASIPTVLAHAARDARLSRGSTVLLLGTAAGISAGVMVVRV